MGELYTYMTTNHKPGNGENARREGVLFPLVNQRFPHNFRQRAVAHKFWSWQLAASNCADKDQRWTGSVTGAIGGHWYHPAWSWTLFAVQENGELSRHIGPPSGCDRSICGLAGYKRWLASVYTRRPPDWISFYQYTPTKRFRVPVSETRETKLGASSIHQLNLFDLAFRA